MQSLRSVRHWYEMWEWLVPVTLSVILVAIAQVNYLLFHTLAELAAIVVGLIMFVVACYTHRATRNFFLLFIGTAYFWVALIDLFHAFSFKGMGVFDTTGSNMTAQFWIAGRFMEGTYLLLAPMFLVRRFNGFAAFVALGIPAVALFALIMGGNFPDAYVEGIGLTAFKITGEYIIIAILLGAVAHLVLRRTYLDRRVLYWMIIAIGLTIGAELCFTFYIRVFDLSNLAGHIFKLFSFWFIFQAITRTMLSEPYVAMSTGIGAYEAIPDPIILINHSGVVQLTNRAARDWCGLPNKEIVGQHCHALFHDTETEPEYCPICRHIELGEKVDSSEVEFPHSARWAEYSLTPIDHMPQNEVMVHVIKEVTQVRTVMRSLNESQQRFRDFASAASDWYWEMDADLRFIDLGDELNETFYEKTGVPMGYLVGKTRSEVMDVEPNDESWRRHQKDLNARRLFRDFRYKWIKDNGEPIHISVSGVPVFDETGRFCGYRGTARDITERQNRARALQLSNARERLLLESSGDAILGIDVNGACTFTNPACLSMLGYDSADELHGKDVHALINHTSTDGAALQSVDSVMYRAYACGERGHADDEVFWRKDGTCFQVEYRVHPMMYENEVIGAVLNFTDITLRKRTEAQLLNTQRMEAVGQLTGGVAHDFNNLLTVISGNLRYVKNRLDETGQASFAAALDDALSASSDGEELTRHLLSFSRGQHGAVERMNATEALSGFMALVGRSLGEGVRMDADIPDNLPAVDADAAQFKSALLNLVLNARDATSDGGDIIVSAKPVSLKAAEAALLGISAGDYVVFKVSDTGNGMSVENAARACEPFFTTKPPGEGSGLGLSMAYGFSRQSGGILDIKSNPGVGTDVSLFLPTRDKPEADTHVEDKPALKNIHDNLILVVEDESRIRKMAIRDLSDSGFRVLSAASGDDALLTLIEEPAIDLVFSDIVMAGDVDGHALSHWLIRNRPETKVLLCTGFDPIAHAADNAGGAPVLTKPYTKDELVQAIQGLLVY